MNVKLIGLEAVNAKSKREFMEWLTILGIVIGNAALFLPIFFWMRSEANADRRDIVNLIIAIKDELKDFHGRLCAIEQSKKN